MELDKQLYSQEAEINPSGCEKWRLYKKWNLHYRPHDFLKKLFSASAKFQQRALYNISTDTLDFDKHIKNYLLNLMRLLKRSLLK